MTTRFSHDKLQQNELLQMVKNAISKNKPLSVRLICENSASGGKFYSFTNEHSNKSTNLDSYSCTFGSITGSKKPSSKIYSKSDMLDKLEEKVSKKKDPYTIEFIELDPNKSDIKHSVLSEFELAKPLDSLSKLF